MRLTGIYYICEICIVGDHFISNTMKIHLCISVVTISSSKLITYNPDFGHSNERKKILSRLKVCVSFFNINGDGSVGK